jgi:hypothetical protein
MGLWLQETFLTKDGGEHKARLDLEPIVGKAMSLDFVVAAGRDSDRNWQVSASPGLVRDLERQPVREALPLLLLLAPASGPQRAVVAAHLPSVQHWRLRFTRPLDRKESVSLSTRLAPQAPADGALLPYLLPLPFVPPGAELWGPRASDHAPSARRWDIPLLVFPGADPSATEIILEPAGVDLVQAETSGLEETAIPAEFARQAAADSWRSFRLRPSGSGDLPQLRLTTREKGKQVSGHPWCDEAHLVTYVQAEGYLLHHFRFHLWNCREREVLVGLPAGARKLLAAKVDGHVLEQVAQQETGKGWQVSLPAPSDGAGHVFELYYRSDTAWSGWLTQADLDVPAPNLSAPPWSLRRTWRLAPGILPLHQERVQPLVDAPGILDELRRAWHAADALVAGDVSPAGEESLEIQRQAFLGAEAGLRRKLAKETSLGEALERLSHDYLKDQLPVVLDRAALRAAGIYPEATLSTNNRQPGGQARPFWEASGLVYVPFPGGPVLTTFQQVEAWLRIYGQPATMRSTWNDAIAQAVSRGHDSSGRFVTLGHWLRLEKKPAPAAPAPLLPAGEGWTTWESRPGELEPTRLIVIQTASLQVVCLLLALLAAALAWGTHRWCASVWCLRLWLSWQAGLALAWVWVPETLRPVLWWPFAVISVCFAYWLARHVTTPVWQKIKGQSPSRAKIVIGGTSACLLLVSGAWLSCGRSEGPETYSVLLVETEPGQQLALVPQDAVRKLTELAKREPSPTGAMLVGVHYKAQMSAGVAQFSAQYEAHSFSERAELFVPLTGVDLQEGASLDGAPVFPIVATGPKSGYVVTVHGKGRHRLALSFTVRPTPVGDYQEVRFSGPRLCSNRLEYAIAGKAHNLHLVGGFGLERVLQTAAGKHELQADLGREANVQVRWRLDRAPSPASTLEVREAYFWDLRPGAVSLSATLQFTPVKGTVSQLALTLPEELDVRSVEATSVSPAMGAVPNMPLKNWLVAGEGQDRQLRIELTGPVANPVQLFLSLVPRIQVAEGNLALRLPLPQAAKSTEGFLAYRVETFDAVAAPLNLGVSAVNAEVFANVWASSGQKAPGTASRAYSFRRTAPGAGVALSLTMPRPKAQAEIRWTVDARHADFVANLKLVGSEELSLVQVHLPPGVLLTEVRGATLHHWARQPASAEIWLAQPQKQVALELAGWAPLARPATASVAGRFALPAINFPGANLDGLPIKVVPSGRVALHTERLHNLSRASEPDGFVSTAPVYEGAFEVRVKPAPCEVQIMTVASFQDNLCTLVSHFHCRAPLVNSAPLQVILRNCPNADARLETTAPLAARYRRLGADHLWEISPAPTTPQPFTFRVRARIPLQGGVGLPLPEVTVLEAPVAGRWVAVTGPNLLPEKIKGLAKVADAARELLYWPGEIDRITAANNVWRIADADWGLYLKAVPSADAAPAKVLFAEEQAFLTESRHWAHQSEFLLASRGAVRLQLRLPRGARLLALTLDHQSVTPRPAGPDSYWVFLSELAAAHTARVYWQLPPDAEQLERPRLGGVSWDDLAAPTVLARLHVPPGRQVSSRPQGSLSTLMQQLWARAQAQLDLSRFLAGSQGSEVVSALAAAQKAFWSCLRRAELQVSCLSSAEEKAKYTAALGELRKSYEQLALQKSFQTPRDADKHVDRAAVPFSALPEQGSLTFWQLPNAGSSLEVLLAPAAETAGGTRWLEVMVAAAVLLFVLSFVPPARELLASLWPELCMLLAALGMFAWGVSVIGILLAGIGVLGRLVWGLGLARRLVVAWFATPAN